MTVLTTSFLAAFHSVTNSPISSPLYSSSYPSFLWFSFFEMLAEIINLPIIKLSCWSVYLNQIQKERRCSIPLCCHCILLKLLRRIHFGFLFLAMRNIWLLLPWKSSRSLYYGYFGSFLLFGWIGTWNFFLFTLEVLK